MLRTDAPFPHFGAARRAPGTCRLVVAAALVYVLPGALVVLQAEPAPTWGWVALAALGGAIGGALFRDKTSPWSMCLAGAASSLTGLATGYLYAAHRPGAAVREILLVALVGCLPPLPLYVFAHTLWGRHRRWPPPTDRRSRS